MQSTEETKTNNTQPNELQDAPAPLHTLNDGHLKWMVCHDGSPASIKALQVTTKGYMSEKDHLYCAHAYNHAKEEYLTYDLKKGWVKQQTEAKHLYLGSRFKYWEEEVKEGETTKLVLNRMANEHAIDVTVCGYHGRKGEKEDPTVMGTAVQYMAQQAGSSILIVKDGLTRKHSPDGFYKYGILIDGSKQSMAGLDLLIRMVQPQDKIITVTCNQANINADTLKKVIVETLEDKGVLGQSEVIILPSEHGKKTSEIIREYILMQNDQKSSKHEQQYLDILFVGNRGADFSGSKDKFLGSVANEVITHTKLNVCFVITKNKK